jgi:glutathione S-transferase
VKFFQVKDARNLSGLRLALSAGVPGPYGEAAKALFKIRRVEYIPVFQEIGAPNPELVDWTGHRNAPVAVYNDEKPRAGWAEILFLAERLGSGASLIPADPKERTLMMGLSHEICGENGLLWTGRLRLVHPAIEAGSAHPAYEFSKLFGDMYGYSKEAGDAAPARCADILHVLSQQLAAQRAAGKRYLVGNALSAVDVYWAAVAATIDPLPDEQCKSPMPPDFRAMYASSPPQVRDAASQELIAHRDFVYREHVGLPLDFAPD